jgi:hypothetical protein
MAAEELNVHDINVKHVPVFNAQGEIKPSTSVNFFVGPHGPFTLSFKPGEDTADNIKAGIQAQVEMLRALTSF